MPGFIWETDTMYGVPTELLGVRRDGIYPVRQKLFAEPLARNGRPVGRPYLRIPDRRDVQRHVRLFSTLQGKRLVPRLLE